MVKKRCDVDTDTAVQIAEMHKDIKFITKLLEGSEGEDGLVKKVGRNTEFRIEARTRNKLYNGMLGSGWLLTIGLFGFTMIR